VTSKWLTTITTMNVEPVSQSRTYIENDVKTGMIEMYDMFIGIACSVLFSFGGIKLYDYLYSTRPNPNKQPTYTPLKRVTRYHSGNVITYNSSNEFTSDEKKICFDFINTLAFVYILNQHTLICKTMKIYDNVRKTGVFKFEDLFIIKYGIFSDMHESKIYNELKSRGINRDLKIITPIWYSFFESKKYDTFGIHDNTTDECNSCLSSNFLSLYDAFDKKNIRVLRSDMISIEIQPYLKYSVVFHKWYKSACFNPKNHDYIICVMMLSLARSIKHCHDLDLVHGDIKPDNILVTYETAHESILDNNDNSSEGNGSSECHQNGEGGDYILKWKNMLHLPVTGKTRNPTEIPTAYLIDFGMCGYSGKDEGTGGTRPFCAPETKNIKPKPSPSPHKKTFNDSDSSTYTWVTLNKQHDIWSWALILYTVTAYRDVYNTYDEFPSDAFDEDGYVNEYQQEYAFEIKTHAFYPVFKKTLCAPCSRTSSIDEIIHDMDMILQGL